MIFIRICLYFYVIQLSSRQFIISKSFFLDIIFVYVYVYPRCVCTHVYAITNASIWSLLDIRWKLHTVLVLKWYINFRIYLNFFSAVFTCSFSLFALQLPFLYHMSCLYIAVVESHICLLKCFIHILFYEYECFWVKFDIPYKNVYWE